MEWLIIVFPQDIACLTPPLKTRVWFFGGGGRGLFIDYPPVTNELNAIEFIRFNRGRFSVCETRSNASSTIRWLCALLNRDPRYLHGEIN